MANITDELLEDVNSLVKGFVLDKHIDNRKVIDRMKEQIAIFKRQWKDYCQARNESNLKLEGKHKSETTTKNGTKSTRSWVEQPDKIPGYSWDDDLLRLVPDDPNIQEPLLPPDPTKWGLAPGTAPREQPYDASFELPCSYATLTTIYDMQKQSPPMQIHTGIWNKNLFALMSHLVDGYYENIKVKEAFDTVKNDLLVQYSKRQKNSGQATPASGGNGEDEAGTPPENYIKKENSTWEFGFNNKPARVDFKPGKPLNGLALIECLIRNQQKEYRPLELLKAVKQREEGETEPEKIYSDSDINKIKEAIEGLKGRAEFTTDLQVKERLEKEIEEAKEKLNNARNCNGKSRKFSEKYTKSVTRNIDTILKKIAPQNTELYTHLNTFLHRGEICCYKPDNKIIWNIS